MVTHPVDRQQSLGIGTRVTRELHWGENQNKTKQNINEHSINVFLDKWVGEGGRGNLFGSDGVKHLYWQAGKESKDMCGLQLSTMLGVPRSEVSRVLLALGSYAPLR